MSLDPKKTAIVLIEYQNDFTSEGGVMYNATKDVIKETNMLENTIDLVSKARKAGCLIIHVPISFSSDYKEIPKPYGVLANVKSAGAFKKGTWGSEIYKPLTPVDEDVVVEGKRGLCGFQSTNLDFILRNRKIENVVLGGFLTNCCVESSMRTAYELGYNVITLKNCTAATSMEAQKNAFKYDFGMFSTPMDHNEFLEKLVK